MYSQIKIKEKAGLVRSGTDVDGNLQWIGTIAQWNDAERTEKDLVDHDCHLPELCSCEEYLDEKEN